MRSTVQVVFNMAIIQKRFYEKRYDQNLKGIAKTYSLRTVRCPNSAEVAFS